jgi:hypothetical protein
MDVIRLIQKSYKNSLASSKVLNCLSCGRGDANFEKVPQYVKSNDNAFFINKLPVTRSKQARYKKPRGQSSYVENQRMKGLGQSMNTRNKGWRLGEGKIHEKKKRPKTGVLKVKEEEVDYGKFI